MTEKRRKLLCMLSFLVLFIANLPTQLWGFGHYTRVIGYNAGAMGRGGTSIAIKDEPSNVNFNPALISEIEGSALDVNLLLIFPNFHFKYDGTGNERYTSTAKDRVGLGPGISYAHNNVNSPWSWGLTFSAPDAIATDHTIQSKNFGPVNAFSEFMHLRFGPIVAYQLTPKLSIGARFHIDYNSLDFRMPMGAVNLNLGQSDGYGFSGGIGLLYKPFETLSVGVYYESQSVIENLKTRNEDASLQIMTPGGLRTYTNMDAYVNDADFPQNFGIGVAYSPSQTWRLSADIRYFNWKKNWEEMEIEFKGSGAVYMIADGVPTKIKIPVNADNQMVISLGLDYYLSEKFSLAMGYCYGDDATDPNYLFPLIPATMEHTITAGISYMPKNNVKLGCSFLYGFFNDPKASGHHGYDQSLEEQLGLPPGALNSELNNSEVSYTVYNVQLSVTVFW